MNKLIKDAANNLTDKEIKNNPLQFMLYLAIGGLSIIFLVMIGSYIYMRVQGHVGEFKISPIFFISTLVIGLSSYTLNKAQVSFESDESELYTKNMKYSLYLSCLFLILQVVGWVHMKINGLTILNNTASYFILAIAMLHALHMIVGMLILGKQFFSARKKLKDQVDTLLLFSNPRAKMNLGMLATYWHFVGILWLVLILFFAAFHW